MSAGIIVVLFVVESDQDHTEIKRENRSCKLCLKMYNLQSQSDLQYVKTKYFSQISNHA